VNEGKWTRETVQKASFAVLVDAMGLRTEVDRIVERFKKTCKTELVLLEKIRTFVTEKFKKEVGDHQLTPAISGAGMTIVRDVWVQNKRQAVVVVNGEKWSRETVKQAKNEVLTVAMMLK
jgi:hypothetical protein